jgi:catechol 2,3-dioxygenase-like lactoylglutathione lyase family enzyme
LVKSLQNAQSSVPEDIEFNHVIVYVSDVKRSLRFYRGLMGFKLIEAYGGYARLQSTKGRTTLALHHVEDGGRPSRGKRVVMYFEVKNLKAFCDRLVRRGVKFSQMPELMPWGWTHAYLEDPDGHEISVYWAGKKRFEKTA